MKFMLLWHYTTVGTYEGKKPRVQDSQLITIVECETDELNMAIQKEEMGLFQSLNEKANDTDDVGLWEHKDFRIHQIIVLPDQLE